jgi:hypothetical protein
MPDGQGGGGVEALTLANGLLSGVGAAAALMIRLTGADGHHSWRYVLADIAGTLALFYLAFLGLLGLEINVMLAVSLAGLASAAGWVVVFGLLKRAAQKRLG